MRKGEGFLGIWRLRRIVADGGDPIASSPEEYAANIEREEGKWEALIKKLDLKVE